jgi:hypothetical protein
MTIAEPLDLEAIRRSVERVGKLSDSLIRLGPFGLGVDGVLNLIPGVGEFYSAAAGAFILVQAARARVSLPVFLGVMALIASRTAITAVPVAGLVAADLFRAHRLAAWLVARAIDRKLANVESAHPVGRGSIAPQAAATQG